MEIALIQPAMASEVVFDLIFDLGALNVLCEPMCAKFQATFISQTRFGPNIPAADIREMMNSIFGDLSGFLENF